MSQEILDQADKFIVGISGGKDSSALLLWLLNESGINPDRIICIFTDTQWEAPEVYEHVAKINRELHPIITLRASKSFLELAQKRGRFPSSQARFCTQELKLKPAKDFMLTLEGSLVSVNGMRREESLSRSQKNEFADSFETYHGWPEWRPLLDWTLEDVFLIHKRYNFPLNPLYGMGFDRVGCMPCIMSKKDEIRRMAKLFPDRVQMLIDAERSFKPRGDQKEGFSSFFPPAKIPERYRSKSTVNKKGETVKVPTIEDVIFWSQTSDRKRSSNFDFHFEDFEEAPACSAGVCE